MAVETERDLQPTTDVRVRHRLTTGNLARLRDRARADGLPTERLVERFLAERFLGALGGSRLGDSLALRGAWCFPFWFDEPHRATRGIDLVVLHPLPVLQIRDVLQDAVGDGLEGGGTLDWTGTTVRTAGRHRNQLLRLRIPARMGSARIPLKLNIAETPVVGARPQVRSMGRPLLRGSEIRFACLAPAAMIAGKVSALVAFGHRHTRLHDIFDLHVLARSLSFDGALLHESFAVGAGGGDPDRVGGWSVPSAREAFDQRRVSAVECARWTALITTVPGDHHPSLPEALDAVAGFVLPMIAAAADRRDPGTWRPDSGWSTAPPGTSRGILQECSRASSAEALSTMPTQASARDCPAKTADQPRVEMCHKSGMTPRTDIAVAPRRDPVPAVAASYPPSTAISR